MSMAYSANMEITQPGWVLGLLRPRRNLALFAFLVFSLPGKSCLSCHAIAVQPRASSIWPMQAEGNESAAADPALDPVKGLVRQGKYSEAEAMLEKYLRGHQNSAPAHVLLGLVEFNEDRPAESLAEFTLAARISPPGANELVIVALDYLKLKDLADADKWMSASLEKGPANAPAWRYLGGIKYAENRFSEAIDAYRKCLQLQPRDILAEDGLGRSYEGLSRDEAAAAAYRLAIDWQSRARAKYAEPLLHFGSLLVHQARAQEAIPYLQAAEALEAGDADVHQQLGEGYTQLNQLDKAQAELEKAVELSPNEPHLHWLLAAVYRKEGLPDKAEKETKAFSALLGSHSSDKVP